jgi:hypothetical protein
LKQNKMLGWTSASSAPPPNSTSGSEHG